MNVNGDAGSRSERFARGVLLLSACTLLAAFTASQIRLFLTSTGSEAPWMRLFFGQLRWWLLWAALVPVVTTLSRRFPWEGSRRGSWVALHLGFAAAVALAQILARVALLPVILGRLDLRWGNEIVFGFSTYFHWNLVLYGLVVACEHAWRYQKRFRERELETSRLQTRLARAELDVLRRQIQPHFVLQLGELRRWTLKHEDAMEVSLRQELDFTERYLEIEKVRFEDRLNVAWDVVPATTAALSADDVDFVRAEGNYVRLHVGSRGYLVRETMDRLEATLGEPFVRIHRSTMVRLDRVDESPPVADKRVGNTAPKRRATFPQPAIPLEPRAVLT